MSFFLKKPKQEMQFETTVPMSAHTEQLQASPLGDVQIGVNTLSNKIVVTLIDASGLKTAAEFSVPVARRLVRTISSMIEIIDEYSSETPK